ncbi:hypothetical protein ABIG06_003935 [Bradyrhizobium sp. USDA 326]
MPMPEQPSVTASKPARSNHPCPTISILAGQPPPSSASRCSACSPSISPSAPAPPRCWLAACSGSIPDICELIFADRAPGVALLLLLASFLITFGSAAMGTAIMAQGRKEDTDKGGGHGSRLAVPELTQRTHTH